VDSIVTLPTENRVAAAGELTIPLLRDAAEELLGPRQRVWVLCLMVSALDLHTCFR
jgi:hypothetical protein